MICNISFEVKLLSKKTCEAHCNFPEHVSISTSIIPTFTNLDKGCLQLVRINEVLLQKAGAKHQQE